ncbi:MAG TPA: NAD(P)-dependent oxidoreductase, partial [Lapillicoccus sp.]|nr:NAD(P)-dependent oxidoreductase [Lapillicoccus sp.]
MADTPGYPATLRLTGRRVLVVGGGAVATRRIRTLLEAGAVVDLIAPDAAPEIREAAAAGRLRWRQRRFQPRDVLEPEPAWLVHAATDSVEVNATVAKAAEEQ